MSMTRDEVRAMALSFPGAEEGTAWGQPAFKACGKFFARIRDEDESLVLTGVGFDEREMLMEAEPETFHITEHYRNYPVVLARLSSVDPGTARNLLERRWRKVAPRAAVKAWDAGGR
jgi:hypothetical protein